MKKIWVIITLLLLSPIIGEVISGSAPPLEFINPVTFITLVLLYGCGTLLIREAKARWGLQWSVVLLAIAYGILEEGTMVQSFFNPSWGDLVDMSGYGMFFGIQWPWTIMLTVFHATMSTLIPIIIVSLLWQEYRDKPLLKKKGIVLSFIGLITITLIWISLIGIGTREGEAGPNYVNYVPNYFLVLGSLVVVVLLCWLAYKFKDSRISFDKKIRSPLYVGIYAFFFQLFNLFIPNVLANLNMPRIITIFLQLATIAIFMWIIVPSLFDKKTTKNHLVSFVLGSILFFILLSPIMELGQGAVGMIPVGIISLVLLILWRRKVLK